MASSDADNNDVIDSLNTCEGNESGDVSSGLKIMMMNKEGESPSKDYNSPPPPPLVSDKMPLAEDEPELNGSSPNELLHSPRSPQSSKSRSNSPQSFNDGEPEQIIDRVADDPDSPNSVTLKSPSSSPSRSDFRSRSPSPLNDLIPSLEPKEMEQAEDSLDNSGNEGLKDIRNDVDNAEEEASNTVNLKTIQSRSRSPESRTPSFTRSENNSPSRSRSRSIEKSMPQSPSGSVKSGSHSPSASIKLGPHSQSRSRSRSRSGKSRSRSRSGSVKSHSRSRSGSLKSRSRSPKSHSSNRSGSPKSRSRSRSGSPKSHSRSRSGSPKSCSRSRSGSPKSRSRSRSGSPKSRSRSRSGSVKSRSSRGSIASRSVSRSVSRSRSRSRSGSAISRSVSRSSRSRSGSRSSRSRSRSRSVSRSRVRSRSGSRSSRSSRSRSRSRSRSSERVSNSPRGRRVIGSDSDSDAPVSKSKGRVRRRGGSSGSESEADRPSRKRVRSGSLGSRSGGSGRSRSYSRSRSRSPSIEKGNQSEGETAVNKEEDSDVEDDAIRDQIREGVEQPEELNDFDAMMARRKAENASRRRRKNNVDIINDNEENIAVIVRKMRIAAEEDRQLNQMRKPATKKIAMMDLALSQLKKLDLVEGFLEANVLTALTDWLAPMPDKSLPSSKIRENILKWLSQLPPLNQDMLRTSGIGKAVMYLYKHPKELKENKIRCGHLISTWARPIFNNSDDLKTLTKEERMERDYELRRRSGIKKSTEDSSLNDDLNRPLRPGDPGWCYRARVPRPSTKDYVNRPKWQKDTDISKSNKKQVSRYDKQLRQFKDKQRQAKARRAVPISIEGRNMAL